MILTAKVLVIPHHFPVAAMSAEAVVLVRCLAVVQVWIVSPIVVTKVLDLQPKEDKGRLNSQT